MSNQPGLAIVLLLAGALLAAARQTDPAAPAKPLTEEQKKELEEANKLNAQVFQLYQQGKYAEALPLARKALEIREKAHGPDHPNVATSLNNLAVLYKSQAQYAKAEPLHQRALKIREKALGPDHPDVATSLGNLAEVYRSQAQYSKAEPLFLRALQIDEKAHGPDHPDVATSLNNLAGLYDSQAQYAKAEPLFLRALKIKEKALGPDHPAVATSLNNLAGLYDSQAQYAKAEPLYQRALKIKEKAHGPDHPLVATSLNNLAVLYKSQAQYAKAEPLHHRALKILEKAHGPDHPDVATSLNNLALMYESQAQYAKAEPLHLRALKIREKALGPDHPDVAQSLNNLGLMYKSQAQYAKAEPLYLRALKIYEKTLGPDHPLVATSLNSLAVLYDSQAQYAKAKPLFQHALKINEKAHGPDHPDVATSLNNLAMNCLDQKQPAEALAHSRKAQQIVLNHLKATAEGQAESAQQVYLQKKRDNLDIYFSAALANGQSAYDSLLAWKGNLFLRQQRQRAFAAGDPQAREIQARLQDTSRQLARLYGSTPKPGEEKPYQDKLTALARDLEKAEQELATVSAPFLRARERALLKPEELAALLPVDTALVDLLEYWHYLPVEGKKGTWERRYLAWVLRPGKPVAQVELGSATKINELVSRWRSGLPKRLAPVEGDTDPALGLRDTVLGPLLPHLEGVKSLLVSPDSQLATVPLAALPGRNKSNYLIEEMEVAVVPFAQAIPDLVGEWRSARGDSMLLVGDVDYGADPGKAPEVGSLAANRQGQPGNFKSLEQTRAEVAAIRDSFEQKFPDGKARQLRKDQATEQAVRGAAPQARWLHLATHGFFAPSGEEKEGTRPEWMSQGLMGSQRQVAAEVPGLLSGLALAGANRAEGLDTDDGILTASEVQGLDLTGVEQAVLSACETGLGKSAGGEGLLGLQRGFQLAGCRTVVASIWEVPDKATMLLMARYYENLWDRKMPKGKALREAQLWMLREAKDFRGPQLEPTPQPAAKLHGTPPIYWAAWVLSGGWK